MFFTSFLSKFLHRNGNQSGKGNCRTIPRANKTANGYLHKILIYFDGHVSWIAVGVEKIKRFQSEKLLKMSTSNCSFIASTLSFNCIFQLLCIEQKQFLVGEEFVIEKKKTKQRRIAKGWLGNHATSLDEDDDDWKEIFMKSKSTVKCRHESKKTWRNRSLSRVQTIPHDLWSFAESNNFYVIFTGLNIWKGRKCLRMKITTLKWRILK